MVPEVQKVFDTYRQTEIRSYEAGGILVGYRRGPHIEVTHITTPFETDIRGRNRFERKDPGHQVFLDQHWKNSGHLLTYVGEWHTHPSRTASPSVIDRTEWNKLNKHYRMPLVFIIVGTEELYIEANGLRTSLQRRFPGAQK